MPVPAHPAVTTRRGFLAVLAAAGLLAACGDGDDTGPAAAPTARRIVTTVHGWDAAVALGETDRVVGVTDFALFAEYVEYLAGTATEGMTPLGPLGEELERLAALEPELLVALCWNTQGPGDPTTAGCREPCWRSGSGGRGRTGGRS
jgi:ABC-type Fe3+-hydroxamate transport system substrate-binding protein